MHETVSYNERMKRSRRMKAIHRRLEQLKKAKSNRHASSAVIQQRAAKLARAILSQKLGGQSGNSGTLSTSAKMRIAQLVDKVPKSRLKALAKRLVPKVTKAERARLDSRRQHQKAQANEEIEEAHVSHRQRSHRKAAAQRSAHKRKSGSGHEQNKHREGSGVGRSINRSSRIEIIKQMGGKLTGREFTDSAIRAMLADKRTSSIKRRSDKRHGDKRGSRGDLHRRSTRANRYNTDTRGGYGSLS